MQTTYLTTSDDNLIISEKWLELSCGASRRLYLKLIMGTAVEVYFHAEMDNEVSIIYTNG